jgi:hypothetical protein
MAQHSAREIGQRPEANCRLIILTGAQSHYRL